MSIAIRSAFFTSGLMLAFTASAATNDIRNGIWDGSIAYGDTSIAFPLEISGSGGNLKLSFFNGDDRVTSTSATLSGQSLKASFDHYGSRLEATVADGSIKGTYGSKRSGFHDIEAHPHRAVTEAAGPDISGVWNIPTESSKGEHAWRFIVRQNGTETSAAILRVDGDTGLLTGSFQNGKFVLTHFDGARAALLEIVPNADGSLQLAMAGGRGEAKKYTAFRPAEAKNKGLAEPDDFTAHTTMKDPNEKFHFSFPDINGKLVSDTDEKFKGKVVIVNVTGSWCPNCHDEAPYLAELYRKYHALGLEIVALDFEEAEQLPNPERLRAFIKQYGIGYTYLVAGEPSELSAKIPQAEHLDCWPTSFILGRNGKVRETHAGFAAAASGEFNGKLKAEFASTIEQLLSENASKLSAQK